MWFIETPRFVLADHLIQVGFDLFYGIGLCLPSFESRSLLMQVFLLCKKRSIFHYYFNLRPIELGKKPNYLVEHTVFQLDMQGGHVFGFGCSKIS